MSSNGENAATATSNSVAAQESDIRRFGKPPCDLPPRFALHRRKVELSAASGSVEQPCYRAGLAGIKDLLRMLAISQR
jgi:hypothetical protein